MPYKKLHIITLSFIATLSLSACNPLSIQPKQAENSVNSQDNLLNLLDPDVTTEEQAIAKGEAALDEGKPDNALFYYVKALQYNKNNVKALEQIAAIHSRKHPELAFKVYRDILAIDSQHALANEYLGLYYLENGQPGKAKEHLSNAVKNNNASWKAHNGLGVIADLAHNNPEAIAHYEAALAIDPSNPMLLNNLGYSYYLSGNEIKAKALINQALSSDSKYKRAIQNLALIQVKEGNYANAVALFNRIMPVHESYNNIGYLSMLNGQYDVAEEYLNRAIDESPVYFPKAQENLKTLSTARTSQLPYVPPANHPSPSVQPAVSNNDAPSETEEVSLPPVQDPAKKKLNYHRLDDTRKPPQTAPPASGLKSATAKNAPPSPNAKESKKHKIIESEKKTGYLNKSVRNDRVSRSNQKKTVTTTQSRPVAAPDQPKPSPSKKVAVSEKKESIPAPVKSAEVVQKPQAEKAASATPEKPSESPRQPVMPIKKAEKQPALKFDNTDTKDKGISDILPPLAPTQNNTKYITDIVGQ